MHAQAAAQRAAKENAPGAATPEASFDQSSDENPIASRMRPDARARKSAAAEPALPRDRNALEPEKQRARDVAPPAPSAPPTGGDRAAASSGRSAPALALRSRPLLGRSRPKPLRGRPAPTPPLDRSGPASSSSATGEPPRPRLLPHTEQLLAELGHLDAWSLAVALDMTVLLDGGPRPIPEAMRVQPDPDGEYSAVALVPAHLVGEARTERLEEILATWLAGIAHADGRWWRTLVREGDLRLLTPSDVLVESTPERAALLDAMRTARRSSC